jgi:hypothetical protein
MTAINVFPTRDAVHLFTDGGVYAGDGSFASFSAKVFTAPHLPLAMTACGPGGAAIEFGYLVRQTVANIRCFD